MREVLVTLISVGLVVAAVFGLPFCLLIAFGGFAGRVADAGQELNTQIGVAYLAIAVAIVLALAGWFKYVVYRK